jgi:hypothetical protein
MLVSRRGAERFGRRSGRGAHDHSGALGISRYRASRGPSLGLRGQGRDRQPCLAVCCGRRSLLARTAREPSPSNPSICVPRPDWILPVHLGRSGCADVLRRRRRPGRAEPGSRREGRLPRTGVVARARRVGGVRAVRGARRPAPSEPSSGSRLRTSRTGLGRLVDGWVGPSDVARYADIPRPTRAGLARERCSSKGRAERVIPSARRFRERGVGLSPAVSRPVRDRRSRGGPCALGGWAGAARGKPMVRLRSDRQRSPIRPLRGHRGVRPARPGGGRGQFVSSRPS